MAPEPVEPQAAASDGGQRSVSRNPVKTIARAMDFACRKHMVAAQHAGKPFGPTLAHIAEIGRLLAELTGGKDQVLVVAGMLHNVARDTDCDLDEIEARFGREVAHLVAELTGARVELKEGYWRTELAMAPGRPPRAKMIMMIVHTSGILSLAAPKPDAESVSRRIERLIWSARIVGACRDTLQPMGEMFDRAYAAALRNALAALEALPVDIAVPIRRSAEEATRLAVGHSADR